MCKLLILCSFSVAFLTSAHLVRGENDEPAPAVPTAQAYFDEALNTLKSHQTIQARLVEQVTISDQPIRLTGRYLSQQQQLRLELSVKLSGAAEGSLLEVSDGDNLWSQTIIADTRQVTLRNLKQIAASLAAQPAADTTPWHPEISVGGISGLMNSLQRTMDFEHLREEARDDIPFVIVQGKWKPEFTEKWQRGKDQPLPTYVPELLRIYFHAGTKFPQRFLYLKRNPEKQTYRPLVRLEFQDVQLDDPVDSSEFEFTPPEDLVPEDVTQQYIDQLTRKSPPSGDDGKPPAGEASAK